MGNCVSDYCLSKTTDKIPLYSMKGQVYRAKVVDVYDGDTCTVVLQQNFRYRKYKVRMLGYDSPEMKPSLKHDNRDIEMESARRAREALMEHIYNKIVILHCDKFDKYGRLLGTIYPHYENENQVGGGFSFNQILINEEFAHEYHGGTKKPFNI